MKILHVAETAKGGVGSFLDELIPLQIERLGEENVRALVPSENRSQLPSVHDDCIVTFARPRRSLRALLELRRELAETVRSYRPDILHLHSTFSGLVGRLRPRRSASPRIIYHPHGWAFEMWQSGWKRSAAITAERLLANSCFRIVAVSEAEGAQGLAAGLPPDKLSVVRNGISEHVTLGPPAAWAEERLKVLFVGRLDRQKGYDTIRQIAQRNQERMSVRVIGESVAEEGTLRGADSSMDHLGWLSRSEIYGQMQACDVVAMPSRWEGLAITALEAMRLAKPLVAFAVGGLPEAIEDGLTGSLIEPDDIASFERALLANVNWQQWGLAGQQRWKHLFTSTRMADELFAVYAQVSAD